MREPGIEHGTAQDDGVRRFLFEDGDIRGEWARLDGAYRDILARHQYAPGVGRLLGEFLAASALLSTTLKYEGKLVLQVRSAGQVPLLMAECDHRLRVRGIARGAQRATATDNGLLLADGHLAITIDPLRGRRYQGIVPLEGQSLAESLDGYFARSEQLGTRLWLAADGDRARGLLLQQLPEQVAPGAARRAAQWQAACSMAATVSERELLGLDAPELLRRLYPEQPVRLFDPLPARFQCSCNRERTLGALSALGRGEIEDLLRERGEITMDCEFCNARYRFDRPALARLLGTDGSKTLH